MGQNQKEKPRLQTAGCSGLKSTDLFNTDQMILSGFSKKILMSLIAIIVLDLTLTFTAKTDQGSRGRVGVLPSLYHQVPSQDAHNGYGKGI